MVLRLCGSEALADDAAALWLCTALRLMVLALRLWLMLCLALRLLLMTEALHCGSGRLWGSAPLALQL